MLRPPPGASDEVTSVDPLAPGHPNGNGNFGWAPLDESSESSEVGQTARQLTRVSSKRTENFFGLNRNKI
jgi:hypothetical protein